MSHKFPNKGFFLRQPIIIEGIRKGWTYEKIGQMCTPPVSRRQIYKDRQRMEIQEFLNVLHDEVMGDLAKLREFGDSKDKRFALSQKMRFLTAMTRAIIPTKIETSITGELPLTVVFSPLMKALPPEEEEE